LVAAAALDNKGWLGPKAFLAAVALNTLAGLVLMLLFTPIPAYAHFPITLASYEKQSLHRQAGLLSAGCSSIASNMPDVTFFYTGLERVPVQAMPQCIAQSDFEGGAFDIPPGYETVFNQGGVRLFKRPFQQS
jgi:hypothetical protein